MRRKDREVTDINEILQFINTAKVLHLGLYDGAYPYIVPLNFGYTYEDGVLTFYMHGAKEGRKLDLMRQSPQVFIELECNIVPVEAGDVACNYGTAYASVMGPGTVSFVEEPAEKIKALNILMKHQTGREFTFTEPMAASVAVFKVTLDSFTAKSRPVPQP